MDFLSVKLVSQTASGRTAILARRNERSPWVQVGTTYNAGRAQLFAEELEEDAERREDCIHIFRMVNWDEDKPLVDPNRHIDPRR